MGKKLPVHIPMIVHHTNYLDAHQLLMPYNITIAFKQQKGELSHHSFFPLVLQFPTR